MHYNENKANRLKFQLITKRSHDNKKGNHMKSAISTDEAPKAAGPYSQGISFNSLIFTSGQIALDPKTNKLVSGGIKEQVRQVMSNLKAVLSAADSDLEKVIKTTVFLKDINDFSVFNEIYAEYFSGILPARSAFQVAALPLNAMVEVEMIAHR
jgi:2-iminobutanoate/2-iminopropanoate deaminase